MAATPVEIVGDEELARALQAARDKIADLSEPHRELAASLVNRARSEAPRQSGALGDSLFPAVGPKAFGVGTALIYGPPINFGWPAHGIEPSLFLNRARDAMVGEAVAGYSHFLDTVVDGIGAASKHG